MRNILELKAGGNWIVLAPDTNISIEMTSPLWNDSGTFSYTFQVPYSANRHIFNASDMPESDVNLKTFRERFELYLYGIGFLFGDMVCTSDEIDTENDRVDVELRSANATFEDAIEGINLTDLYLGADCKIGEYFYNWGFNPDATIWEDETYHAFVNETQIYPKAKYCNIPMLVNYKDDEDKDKGILLSAHRAYTSPCMFVLYILKRIMLQTGFSYDEQKDCELMNIEDMKRLIIINNKFEYDMFTDDKSLRGLFATAKNLPDIGISEFIKSLKNAFGVRFLFDESLKKCKVVLLRNIFRSNHVSKLNFSELLDVSKKHILYNGSKISYNTTDGTEFDYSEYSNSVLYPDYITMRSEWRESNYDTILKIIKDTGNFYRTKIDSSSYDKPALFEVAQFLPYENKGHEASKEKPEEIKISFTPVIPTAVGNSTHARPFQQTEEEEQYFKDPGEAFFLDVETIYKENDREKQIESHYTGEGNSWYWKPSYHKNIKEILDATLDFTVGILRTTPEGSLSEDYAIIRQNVDGFGNDEWIQTISVNRVTSDSVSKEGAIYDYNGTDEGIGAPLEQLISLKIWNGKQNLPPNYQTTDSETRNKVEYNNNPTGPLPNRGLVPQFLSELLHFMKHRKPISVVGYMHISDLVNVEWDKYHEVAGYRGLLDKIKFTVSMEGMSEVTVDHYLI